MCGIAGIRKYGQEPIREIMIRFLLTGLEHRGNDATGMAFQQADGSLNMLKMDIPAWKFVSTSDYRTSIKDNLHPDTTAVILHTRAATKGNPRFMKNNHPLYAKDSMMIHNGVISNDDEMFRNLNIERFAETDSDIFRGIVDKFGITKDAIKQLNRLRGSVAIAGFHPEFPGKLILGRSGSPIVLGSTPDHFVFASEKNVIHRAMRPWVKRFEVLFQKQSLDIAFSPFPDNTCWILGPEGLEYHGEMSTTYGTYREPVRRIYNGWSDRQRNWDRDKSKEDSKRTNWAETITHEEKPTTVKKQAEEDEVSVKMNCPHCNKALAIPLEMQDIPVSQLFCPEEHGGCGRQLKMALTN